MTGKFHFLIFNVAKEMFKYVAPIAIPVDNICLEVEEKCGEKE